jgi:Na+/H+-dicarboxylate symporter
MTESSYPAGDPEKPANRSWFPLWAQVVLGLVLGMALGVWAGKAPIIGHFGTEDLGRIGMLVIRALKALAVPLVALVIVDALLRFQIEGRAGVRLLRICLCNVSVAMAIGLVLTNLLHPGRFLAPLFGPLMDSALPDGKPPGKLDFVSGLESIIPTSLGAPFVENTVLSAALIALLVGAALRTLRGRRDVEVVAGVKRVEQLVLALSEAFQLALIWVVKLVPFAAFALVAHAVGKAGLAALSGLWAFLAMILLGFVLHALVYYPALAWWLGRRSPRVYLGGGRDAIITALATNSSLATVPVTLRCLTQKIGVSEKSARLAACLGTNLNNDGITLYEAMAVLMIAQASGIELGISQQLVVVVASIMAGAGIAGIPEAGLVMLPTVLSAVGLPDIVVAAAIPLVVPVDWVLARARSVVNVLSDMVVAIVLDREPATSELGSPLARSGLPGEGC